MQNVPPISDAEWKVMKVLWAKSPQPAYDVIETLAKTEDWHPNTIKTMLGRLQKKGALGVKRYKNLYLYFPLVDEEECVQAESESFLDRLFGGAVKPLLLHFVKRQKLTAKDLEELREILRDSGKH